MSAEKAVVYIGYDPREEAAYRVAEHSLRRRASIPVEVVKLDRALASRVMVRPVGERDGRLWCPISGAHMSTEFANIRFAVPHLQKFEGWALFVDCDVLFVEDIAKLWELRDEQYAVQVVKHRPSDSGATKMDGQLQVQYPRKNWSSVVLWNCAHPMVRALTRQKLEKWPGRDLHSFKWLNEAQIGALPPAWNHLVDVDPWSGNHALLHYTLGGPWFAGREKCGYADAWLSEYKLAVREVVVHGS